MFDSIKAFLHPILAVIFLLAGATIIGGMIYATWATYPANVTFDQTMLFKIVGTALWSMVGSGLGFLCTMDSL